MRVKQTTTPPSQTGIDPAAIPEPMPRPTIGMRCSASTWTTSAVCSVVSGSTTRPGSPSAKVAS